MGNKALLEKYRHHLVLGVAFTVTVASLIEILASFIFVRTGKSELAFSDAYLRGKVLLPIIINVAIAFTVYRVNRWAKISSEKKNAAIIYCAMAVAFVISVIHREFIVNTGTYVFPMILSAVFNDKKLVTRTFIIALFSTTVTVLFSWHDNAIDTTNMINYIVMYGFLVVSFVSCYISIKFSKLQIQLITNQAEENNQLQNKVLLDPMTGLYNHRTFYTELDSAISVYSEKKEEFCLAILDIDNFKHINDLYGHDCGDVVIKHLAKTIKENCTDCDLAFRYGGEEFAIIFKKKSLDESVRVLGDVLGAFADKKYTFTDERITFSGGIAEYSDEMNREEFFSHVDKLMYKAKTSGKNQIKSA